MTRLLTHALSVLSLCLAPVLLRPAQADMCTADVVPAATLLIPYFAVDMSDCSASAASDLETTIFYVHNATPAPLIAHAVVWTDLSVPTFTFGIYLTGYDMQAVSLRDVLCSGEYPDTGLVTNPELTAEELSRFLAWHQGRPDPDTGKCAASDRDSDTGIGYVTIDNVVQAMDTATPADGDSYFTKTSNLNQLTGHVYHLQHIDTEEATLLSTPVTAPEKQNCRKKNKKKAKIKCRARNKAIDELTELLEPKVTLETETVRERFALQGYPAVHIEAEDGFTSASTATGETFYGRYAAGGTDNREPLSSNYSSLYRQTLNLTSTDDPSKHDLIFWRTGTNKAESFTCGLEKTIHPFNVTQVIAFDEAETAVEVTNSVSLPYETELIENFSDTVSPFSNGWFAFDLSGEQAYILQRRDGIYDTAGVVPLVDPCTGNGRATF
jgi:hypothetical protein